MAKFKKGGKAGPGRPKGSCRNAQAKEWAETEGIPFLIRVAQGKEKNAGKDGKLRKVGLYTRVEVAEYLIDQGIGRAPQRHEVSGQDGEPVRLFFENYTGQPDGRRQD